MSRTVRILGPSGAGKSTLLGNLIYKSSLDMATLEQLSNLNVQTYDRLPGALSALDIGLCIRTRRYLYTVTLNADSNTPDCVLYVLEASKSSQTPTLDISDDEELAADAEVLKCAKKVIVLVNKMDKVCWNQSAYDDAVKHVKTTSKSYGIECARLNFLPISALHGDNLLDESVMMPWSVNPACDRNTRKGSNTLLDAMDEI